ncbi:MAG TPA: hypothetical protein VJQ55_15690, partial [Candidatus Binatia bacterium]|nr:hypothetical protein [Candidatus Binatia bacterium]
MVDQIPLGVGFYSRAEAARLLKVTPSRLNRWIRGYTYRLRQGSESYTERQKSPVVRIVLPTIDSVLALSFVELIELRVIKAFTDKGLPLQRVRVAAERAIELFQTPHLFASRRVFTDGDLVFAEFGETKKGELPDVVELTHGKQLQIHSGVLLEGYLDEVSFNQKTLL